MDTYRVFDRDGNGDMDIIELRRVVKMLGEKLTEEELQEMINYHDVDGDGEVSYEEFATMMY